MGIFIPSPTCTNILDAIQQVEIRESDAVMICLGEEEHPEVTTLIDRLNEREIRFFGGIFPGILFKTGSYTKGALLKVVPDSDGPFLIKDISQSAPYFQSSPYFEPRADSVRTAMVLVDGLSAHLGTFLMKLYHQLGNSVSYLGGGAGSLSLNQSPCIFSNEGIFQDAAVILLVNRQFELGVHHGWQKVHGPLVATRTEKNIIWELNWENAFDVYSAIVNREHSENITADNFFSISKGFPFGILTDGMEDIVRDPIAVNKDGGLVCVGEVPPNSVLNILKGENENLIRSAAKAASATLVPGGKVIQDVFVIDCISRVLFLEDAYPEELAAISAQYTGKKMLNPPSGILSLGEISSYGDGYLELFNKTVVLGAYYG